MYTNRFYLVTLLFVLAILVYINYQIFQPFLTAITWAIVFCVIFYPIYIFILRYVKIKALASLISLLLILLTIIGPLSYMSIAIIGEIKDLTGRTGADSLQGINQILSDQWVKALIERIHPYIGIKDVSTEQLIIENTRKFGTIIVDQITTGFTNILSLTVNFLFMSLTIFFLFKDGPDFFQKVKDYMPFSEQQKDKLTSQIIDVIVSTIYGGVIVAVIQGILGGIAFSVLGISSPVLWGSVMAMMSFVPLLGTAGVWGPAAAILIIKGLLLKGIILILIGIFVISMVDNILKPIIIGGRTKMPTLIILFSVLGGIKFFGLLGLVLGPLVFALLLSVLEIFRTVEGGTDA